MAGTTSDQSLAELGLGYLLKQGHRRRGLVGLAAVGAKRCSALRRRLCAQRGLCLSTGKAYSLTYIRVEVTDAAEIKFVAEKAESRAQLTVKGNYALGAIAAQAVSRDRPTTSPRF